jgi:hypothetical protein
MASARHRGLETFDHAVEGTPKLLMSSALSSPGAIDGDRDKNGWRLSPASSYRIATATSVSIGATEALEMDEGRAPRSDPP